MARNIDMEQKKEVASTNETALAEKISKLRGITITVGGCQSPLEEIQPSSDIGNKILQQNQ